MRAEEPQAGNGLVRVLARRDVLALAFGAMIGWAWIPLTGTFILNAGTLGAVAAFLVGGVAIGLVGLTYAELVAAMPKVGGEHVYSYRALGHLSSFVCTWAIVFGYISVVAFEAVAFPTVIQVLFPDYAMGYLWTIAGWDVQLTWVAVGVIGSIAMVVINYYGISMAAMIQSVVVAVIVISGLLFFSGALVRGDVATMEPLFVGGVAGMTTVLVMVPFLLVGLDVIPQAAEEINLPFKEIGNVLLVSIGMALVFYMIVVIGTGMMMSAADLQSETLAVPAAMARIFAAPWASHFIVLAGLAGIITSWIAFYIGGARAIYALAEAGMLPAFLAKLHPVHRTPVNAVLLIGVVTSLAPLLGRPAMVWLVNAGGLGIIVAYFFVALSFLVLRYKEPDMSRPFRVPAGKVVGAAAAICSFLLALLFILPASPSALTPIEWAMFGGWMVFGLFMYSWALLRYGRDRTARVMKR